MKESCSCQDHGELTGVVRVVEPGLVVDVPGMVPSGEPHDAISGLTPHSERNRTTQNKSAEFLILKSMNGKFFVLLLLFMVCLMSQISLKECQLISTVSICQL